MLFIFVFGIASIVPFLESTDYLLTLPNHLNQIYIGGVAQLIMVGLYLILIDLKMSIIKTYHEQSANYFLVSSSISVIFHLVGIILLMLFLPLSNAYLESNHEIYLEIGEVLRRGRDLTNHIVVILPYLLGSFIFYRVLLKNTLVNNWIVYLGYTGLGLACLASLLILFNIITLLSPIFSILSLPLALQELLLAILFITKKVNLSYVKPVL